VLYATHILDGLDRWATDVALLQDGAIARFLPITAIAGRLSSTVEGWLRR
jgi:ABC-type uncharacterized transport system ATPase subunit